MIKILENKLNRDITIVTTLSSFMTAFMGSSINVALPVIGIEFNTSTILLSWLATAYLLTTAVLLVPIGRMTDILGRTKFFKLGIIIFTLGSLLCFISTNAIMLLIFRLVQGVGASFIFSTATSILVSAFPPQNRGQVLGINITSVYLGLLLGPTLGGIISEKLGWRYIFLFNILIGIIVTIVSFSRLKKDWIESPNEKFDFIGSFIFMITIILLMLGFTFIPSPIGFLMVFIGIIIFFVFIFVEKNASFPIVNIFMFKKNRTFTFSNIAALINYSATFAIGFLMSLFLQSIKNLPPSKAGLIIGVQPLFMSIFSPFAGKLSDKIEPQKLASFGMALITAVLIGLGFVNQDIKIIFIIIALAILGFGFALFSSPNTNAVMSSVEKKFYGVASSLLSSFRLLGQMFSMGFVIVVFSIILGQKYVAGENIENFILSIRISFWSFACLCFIGIFASLARGKIHSDE
ncbi:MAG: MFS transporter [Ignavibacteria bacterium]|nr:MFS transporter [Ignavibacteria bacterium]